MSAGALRSWMMRMLKWSASLRMRVNSQFLVKTCQPTKYFSNPVENFQWNILVEAYRNLNPVMELYKDCQRKNLASLEIFSVVPSSLFIYINIVIKYSSILSITLSSHVPSFYILSQHGTNVQSNLMFSKTKNLRFDCKACKRDWCLMSIIHSDRNYCL